MSASAPALSRVAQLKNAFDSAFTVPPAAQVAEQIEGLLSIRVADSAYAVRVNELSALSSDRKIIAIPSPMPELIGITGIRGEIVPVYSLSALLGHAQDEPERWLVLCRREDPIGFAFKDLEGYIQVPVAQIHSRKSAEKSEHAKRVIRTADSLRTVIGIAALVERITARCETRRVSEEP